MVSSFELHLRAEKKSPKTIRTYVEAVQWMAASYLIPAGVPDWPQVTARHVQEWTVTLLGRYSDCYANNQFRALQQFFKWHATEHRLARVPALWLGVRGGPMTASGIYQVIERRGREAGVEVNPHKFRHHFSHTFSRGSWTPPTCPAWPGTPTTASPSTCMPGPPPASSTAHAQPPSNRPGRDEGPGTGNAGCELPGSSLPILEELACQALT
jgi:site-specific recombinase XerC